MIRWSKHSQSILASVFIAFVAASCADPIEPATASFTQAESGIRISELDAPPVLAGMSGAELLDYVDSRSEARSASAADSPAFHRTTLTEASQDAAEVWIPARVPRMFPQELAIAITPAFDIDLLLDSEHAPPLPRIIYAGRDGSILTITASRLMRDETGQLAVRNIPVGANSTAEVEVDATTGGLMVYGHWLVQVNEAGTSVEQSWDHSGAKRLLFAREGMMFEVDIMPASALTDQQLIDIGASLELAGAS